MNLVVQINTEFFLIIYLFIFKHGAKKISVFHKKFFYRIELNCHSHLLSRKEKNRYNNVQFSFLRMRLLIYVWAAEKWWTLPCLYLGSETWSPLEAGAPWCTFQSSWAVTGMAQAAPSRFSCSLNKNQVTARNPSGNIPSTLFMISCFHTSQPWVCYPRIKKRRRHSH